MAERIYTRFPPCSRSPVRATIGHAIAFIEALGFVLLALIGFCAAMCVAALHRTSDYVALRRVAEGHEEVVS